MILTMNILSTHLGGKCLTLKYTIVEKLIIIIPLWCHSEEDRFPFESGSSQIFAEGIGVFPCPRPLLHIRDENINVHSNFCKAAL